MFLVSEDDAAAIRAAVDRAGELGAAVELRRRFPGISDNVEARRCALTIVSWAELPDMPPNVTPLRPRKRS